jgi:hypothetical protein
MPRSYDKLGWQNADLVFAVAQAATKRRIAQKRRSSRHPSDSLIAIVFSAAAIETFMNEVAAFATHATYDKTAVHEDPRVLQFARACAYIEESHGSTNLKVQAALEVFLTTPLAKGKQPYQDFALLMRIRNEIMHGGDDQFTGIIVNFQTGKVTSKPPKLAKELASRGLKLGVERGSGSLIQWLDSADVARWACNAAATVVGAVIDAVPGTLAPPHAFHPEIPTTWGLHDQLHNDYYGAFSLIR